MSEADRIKLTKGEGDSLERLAGVKPGHRKKAHYRAVRRGDPRAVANEALRKLYSEAAQEMLGGLMCPNPFRGLDGWRAAADIPIFFGLDRTADPVRFYGNKDETPNWLRRTFDRLRRWALQRPRVH